MDKAKGGEALGEGIEIPKPKIVDGITIFMFERFHPPLTSYSPLPSSQSPQLLHHAPDALHVPLRSLPLQALDDLLGCAFLEVQKPFHQFAVDEAEGFVRLADLIAKGAIGEKGYVARGREEGCERVLEVDEQRLGPGGKEGEEVDRSFDLEEEAWNGLVFSAFAMIG